MTEHQLNNSSTGITIDDVPAISGIKSPARRQLLALCVGICGATVASSIYRPAQADLAATLNKLFNLDGIVLNFAFEIEELEADFFTRASTTKGYRQLTGQEQTFINNAANQDRAHYEDLKTLRAKYGYRDDGSFENPNASASRRPRTFSYPSLNSRDDLLKAALDIKENVLFTYHGAIGLVRNKEILGAAAAIAGTEGRHVAVLRELLALDPVPAPFEGAITAQVAGRKFSRYGVQGGAAR